MKVLHVIARMNVGGTARYLETLSHGLTAVGIQNVIATGHVQSGEIEDECVNSLPIRRIRHLGRAISPLADLRARNELKQVIMDFQPDVIHTHTFKAGLIGRSIRFGGRRVHTYHGHVLSDGSLSRWQVALVRFSEGFLAGRTDVLISVGETVAQELRDLGIGRNSKWQSIGPGVEKPRLPSRQQALQNLGLNEDRVRVGWLGRMVGVKDPALALDVARKMPELEFLLAGGGELLESIRESAPQNAKVLGWVDRNDLLAATDVIILTSKSEGMPIAAIEAQLVGLPVIAPNVGSLREVLSNGETGFLVDRSANGFVGPLKQLIEDASIRARMGTMAHEHSTVQFSIARLTKEHQALYLSLLGDI